MTACSKWREFFGCRAWLSWPRSANGCAGYVPLEECTSDNERKHHPGRGRPSNAGKQAILSMDESVASKFILPPVVNAALPPEKERCKIKS